MCYAEVALFGVDGFGGFFDGLVDDYAVEFECVECDAGHGHDVGEGRFVAELCADECGAGDVAAHELVFGQLFAGAEFFAAFDDGDGLCDACEVAYLFDGDVVGCVFELGETEVAADIFLYDSGGLGAQVYGDIFTGADGGFVGHCFEVFSFERP